MKLIQLWFQLNKYLHNKGENRLHWRYCIHTAVVKASENKSFPPLAKLHKK